MTCEIILGILSLIVDIIAIIISAISLNTICKVKNTITTNTVKSDVNNDVENVKIGGNFVGRDNNSNNKK